MRPRPRGEVAERQSVVLELREGWRLQGITRTLRVRNFGDAPETLDLAVRDLVRSVTHKGGIDGERLLERQRIDWCG